MKIIKSYKSWDYEGLDTPSIVVEIASGDDLTGLFKDMKNEAIQEARNSGRFSRIDFGMVNDKCYTLYYYNCQEKVYYTLID